MIMKKPLIFIGLLSFCTLLSSIPSPAEATLPPIRVTALKGPTAMGLAAFMDQADQGNISDPTYDFQILGAVDEAAPMLVRETTDFAAIPANLASVLYNNTQGAIQVLAVNTLGVLYLAERGETVSSPEDLRGKTIYASGKGATPEYALRYILSENGIDPEKDVTIEWKSEHTECLSALLSDASGIAMLPQPFVTTAMQKSEDIRIALDLNQAWEELQEDTAASSALITGVVVGRREFILENPEAVEDFLTRYQESIEFVNANTEEAAELIGSYDIVPVQVAKEALPACNITFIQGQEMKEKLSGYLKVLLDQNPKAVGGSLPPDDFYYLGEE